MEINRGSLDDIFRTALSERPGSCVSTVSAPPVVEMGPTTRPDVLTSENASPQYSSLIFNDDNFDDEQSTRKSSALPKSTGRGKKKKEKKKNLTNEADPPHPSMSEEYSWPDPADLVRLRYLNEKLALLNPLRYPLPDIFADRSVASQDSEAIIADLESRLGTWPPGFCTPPPRDRLTKEEVEAVVKEALESHRLNPLPPLSQAMRAALLKDPYTTSFTRLDPDPQDI